MSSGLNINYNLGTQGGNFTDCTLQGNTFNIGQPDHKTDISESFVKYKKWVSEEKEHSIARKKLKQLVHTSPILNVWSYSIQTDGSKSHRSQITVAFTHRLDRN